MFLIIFFMVTQLYFCVFWPRQLVYSYSKYPTEVRKNKYPRMFFVIVDLFHPYSCLTKLDIFISVFEMKMMWTVYIILLTSPCCLWQENWLWPLIFLLSLKASSLNPICLKRTASFHIVLFLQKCFACLHHFTTTSFLLIQNSPF